MPDDLSSGVRIPPKGDPSLASQMFTRRAAQLLVSDDCDGDICAFSVRKDHAGAARKDDDRRHRAHQARGYRPETWRSTYDGLAVPVRPSIRASARMQGIGRRAANGAGGVKCSIASRAMVPGRPGEAEHGEYILGLWRRALRRSRLSGAIVRGPIDEGRRG